jgi:thiamine-phosphate pyrophosphorylase
MPSLKLPPLYAILDPEQAKGRVPSDVVEALLEGGARLIQLRAKKLAPREILDLARAIAAPIRRKRCLLIINDRADIALASGADGVHLGQDDLPLSAARRLMAGKIVGISTHDLEQAREAERGGADYIGFGPMFATATKDTGYSARGPEMLRAIRAAVTLPIVAIGGITEGNVAHTWRAGADSAAIISDILGAEHISAKVARILGAAPAYFNQP